MINNLLGFIFILSSSSLFGQKSNQVPRFFDDPIIADSSSTLIIPTKYNGDLLTSSKITLWNDYYANIVFYDFKTDSFKILFKDDTFIKGFKNDYYYYHRYERNQKPEYVSREWIFYFVKTTDYDESGRVDNKDPSILFVSDKRGDGLKAITPANQNAVSIDIFDNQGFALIKMQCDVGEDNDFETNDKDFYYVRLDLITLELGNKVEI